MSIENVFVDYSQYLNNVYGVDYTNLGKERTGWDYISAIFCDSLVLWYAVDWSQNKMPSEISMAMTLLRGILSCCLKTTQFKIFCIGKGKWTTDDKNAKKLHKRKAKKLDVDKDEYQPGYISLRVSFENISYEQLWPKLKEILRKARKQCMILHDLDISVDCANISTRNIIKEYILANGVKEKDIVNDRNSVGDNCISWKKNDNASTDIPLRIKVYNKFVQMLESRELRSLMGSQLHHLVANPNKDFQDHIANYRRRGMTRIEITFYTADFKEEDYYTNVMSKVLKFLDNCPTYKVSFDKQWKQLSSRLTQMLAVYVPDKETFAYCHWWNSLTRRMQGMIKRNVPEDYSMLHLANLSFNDRPIHYLVVKFKKNGGYKVLQESVYYREKGCTAITIVPGLSNSLTPYRKDMKTVALPFADVGLRNYYNITLEWPEQRLRMDRGDKLANIVLAKEESNHDTERCLEHLDPFPTTRAKADYLAMEAGEDYQVIGYGKGNFRGKDYLYLKISGGFSVRCSRGMEQEVHNVLKKNALFTIRIIRIKKVHGIRDVDCEVIRSQ